jgi:integrase/recombinase XerC
MDIVMWTEIKERFLEYCKYERSFTPASLRAYTNDFNNFKLFWEQLECDRSYTYIEAQDKYLQELYYRKAARTTLSRRLSCYNSFGKFLERYGISTKYFKIPRRERKLPTFISEKEMAHLLDKIPHNKLATRSPYRDMAILELLYSTGIRSFELCNIKLEDVDPQEYLIRIRGKGSKDRMVVFGKRAKSRIRRYMKYERSKINPSEYLFITHKRKGNKMIPRSIQTIINNFKPFLTQSKRIAPHMLRHSFATHMMNKGMDVRMIQSLLGHNNINTTENYTHVSIEKLKNTCELIHPLNFFKKK